MHPTNEQIAEQLDHIARLLELQQEANPFRIQAYHRAAEEVREMNASVIDLVEEKGSEALQQIPNIGSSLAGVITEIAHTGHSSLLQRLQGEVTPVKMLETVPGIGEELAQRILGHLDITSLEGLEQAAHDGRLAEVPGFGEERVRSVQVSLAGLLSPAAQRRSRRAAPDSSETDQAEPPVELLLQVDEDYRQGAADSSLTKIAPKRFNPDNEAWLPILEVDRQGWHLTALFSNTKRAHDLGKTHDWVVIYYKQNGEEGQVTVVTGTQGELEGKRVVRGKEGACRRFYERRDES
jgi:DNA polymerase (family X)